MTLPAPEVMRPLPGRGQVTLDWQPVPGAIGYVVLRGNFATGPFQAIDHGPAAARVVPHPPYADTTGVPGRLYHYAVVAMSDVGVPGVRSASVAAASTVDLSECEPVVLARVRADQVTAQPRRPWRPVIGSEHLSHLLRADPTGSHTVDIELAEALHVVRTEHGVRWVRAPGILGDDLGVYREVGGMPVYDFTGVDRVFDLVLTLGMRPVVELSFMPRDLARDPSRTVFDYRAIVSPPKDWGQWADLVRNLVKHLVGRYGLDEVRDHWAFQVWYEASPEVYWAGTRDEFFRLYDVSARAVKEVHSGLRVGVPAGSAAGRVGELLGRIAASGTPIDFLNVRTDGDPPLDFRPLCARHALADLDLWWTSSIPVPAEARPIGDDPFAAALLLRGLRSAAGRVDAIAHWALSDHVDAHNRPARLFHGGFGLLTVGNLGKPRHWALVLAEKLGPTELAVELSGDGAGSLVEVWAARRDDGTIGVLIWNVSLDPGVAGGDPTLDRMIDLRIEGLQVGYRVRHYRVDDNHSNVKRVWEWLGGGRWPTVEQWEVLRAGNVLQELLPRQQAIVDGSTLAVRFPLPMPAISYLELVHGG